MLDDLKNEPFAVSTLLIRHDSFQFILHVDYGTVYFSLHFKTHGRFLASLIVSLSFLMTLPIDIEKSLVY